MVNDGRKSLDEIHEFGEKLVCGGWGRTEIKIDGFEPVEILTTETSGKALWVLSGVHGEEPAGPCAVTDSIDNFKRLADRDIPMVIVPVCNPSGYSRNWRYPDGPDTDHSVGDSDHLLISGDDPGRSRLIQPSSFHADALTSAVLDLSQGRPPRLVFDHHEDDEFPGPRANCYLFSQGRRGRNDPVARMVRQFLKRDMGLSGFDGQTDIGQIIRGGIVGRSHDGSIDELFSARRIVRSGRVVGGPGAEHVFVVETDARPSMRVPLEERVTIHKRIMGLYGGCWSLAESLDDTNE